jgi:hypothetical protein
MAEVQLEEHTYRTGRLTLIQQWEVFRRAGPILPMLSSEFLDGYKPAPGARWIMSAVSGLLARLNQEDADVIRQTALSAVERFDPTAQRWFPIVAMNGTGGVMYQDMGLLTMLELMDRVLQENMGSFFAQLRAASERESTAMEQESPLGLPPGLH